jgi:uncharacterized protein (TIGR03067 family)
MSKYLLFLAVGLTLAFAPAPFPRASRRERSEDDLKKSQGTWEIVSRTRGGQAVGHVVATAEIGSGKYTLVNASGNWRSPFIMALDHRAKPRTIDLKSEKGNASARGIYELKGDLLRLSYVFRDDGLRPGDARPTDFEGQPPEVYLDVFKRRKP